MNISFDWAAASRTVSGLHATRDIGSMLDGYGLRRVLVLTDAGVKAAGIADGIIASIQATVSAVNEITDLAREPGVEDVDAVMAAARTFEPDCVVGIGGGSVLDVAKLCAVLVKSEHSVLDLLDGTPVPAHSTFTCLVPTTAGTGSEGTKNAIIAIPSRQTKGAVVHERLLPDLVFLDPALTLSLPRHMTASTGMDALCHAMECFISRKANEMSDLLATDAMRRIARSLRKAADDERNIDARSDMLLASYYAGMCITLAGTNAVHALSYPLGVEYHVPHGQANAMLLPVVMEQNALALPEKTRTAAECFGYDAGDGGQSPAEYLVAELHSLVADLGIETSLATYGVKPDHVDSLTESAVGNRRLMDNNPFELSGEQVRSMYLKLIEGAA